MEEARGQAGGLTGGQSAPEPGVATGARSGTKPVKFRIPPLIRRNTALFSLSQTFTGPGMQLAYGFGPLMVLALTNSAHLAGITVALISFSRFLIAYPIGRITDTWGRKPGILLGLVLAMAGAIVMGLSMLLRSFPVLVGGMLLFGMGMNAAQQLRVAATDMFPPNRRAEALGYVAMGALFGLILSPLMVLVSEGMAKDLGIDQLALPWFLLPGLIIPGMLIISFVQPDPKEIGMNLERYYPGYVTPPRPSVAGGMPPAKFSAGTLLCNPQILLALVANCAAYANMTIVMVLTSLVLSHHGHSLYAIAFSHMFHSMGMFAFTIPLGRLTDRIGRDWVMFPGVAVALVGASLVAFTGGYWLITLGTFLVGLGWAGANVAATALIADNYQTEQRGRAIGVSESCAGATNTVTALMIGPLVEWGGLPASGLAAVICALPPLLMLAARPLASRK